MRKVSVSASKTYDILIERGLLKKAGELCTLVVKPCKCVVLTDDNVAPLYADELEKSLSISGFSTIRYTVAHGEISKSADCYISLLNFLAENKITRSDILVALGGGVVGDLCGFTAATYLRGIKFIQVPTTLLAMVDSSVGGKTAINLSAGKNLAGAFYQPSLVICDPDTLSTLPAEIFSDGCAEVVKYGIINDKALFNKLSNPLLPQIEDIIENCVKNKRDIVNADEYDTGVRQLLNLGHTAAHAIEILSGFEISHGSAVSIGTVIITKAAIKMGLCPEDSIFPISSLLSSLGLRTDCPYSAKELAEIATSDKKRTGGTITLVVPYDIGDSRLYKVNVSELENIFSLGLK